MLIFCSLEDRFSSLSMTRCCHVELLFVQSSSSAIKIFCASLLLFCSNLAFLCSSDSFFSYIFLFLSLCSVSRGLSALHLALSFSFLLLRRACLSCSVSVFSVLVPSDFFCQGEPVFFSLHFPIFRLGFSGSIG